MNLSNRSVKIICKAMGRLDFRTWKQSGAKVPEHMAMQQAINKFEDDENIEIKIEAFKSGWSDEAATLNPPNGMT